MIYIIHLQLKLMINLGRFDAAVEDAKENRCLNLKKRF